MLVARQLAWFVVAVSWWLVNGLHDPGLDVDSLLALRPTTCRTDTAAIASIVDRIGNHLLRHDGYVAFSGGKDSMVALDLARRADPDVPVVFFDSGLEFPETLVRASRGTRVRCRRTRQGRQDRRAVQDPGRPSNPFLRRRRRSRHGAEDGCRSGRRSRRWPRCRYGRWWAEEPARNRHRGRDHAVRSQATTIRRRRTMRAVSRLTLGQKVIPTM
ncbi:phosphoadenosine phosphosulfate reductase family protein [Rhodococcus hoagii]|nr:phosphoadenosine phosphosulfate reductase family protein [Prescottella equi]